ncbi:hypothetical protein CMI37_20370 [Candidatus Pacearchaeota archaeon]|nr:hypothetical protein [Candidatus Pacearchaeota archaeon]
MGGPWTDKTREEAKAEGKEQDWLALTRLAQALNELVGNRAARDAAGQATAERNIKGVTFGPAPTTLEEEAEEEAVFAAERGAGPEEELLAPRPEFKRVWDRDSASHLADQIVSLIGQRTPVPTDFDVYAYVIDNLLSGDRGDFPLGDSRAFPDIPGVSGAVASATKLFMAEQERLLDRFPQHGLYEDQLREAARALETEGRITSSVRDAILAPGSHVPDAVQSEAFRLVTTSLSPANVNRLALEARVRAGSLEKAFGTTMRAEGFNERFPGLGEPPVDQSGRFGSTFGAPEGKAFPSTKKAVDALMRSVGLQADPSLITDSDQKKAFVQTKAELVEQLENVRQAALEHTGDPVVAQQAMFQEALGILQTPEPLAHPSVAPVGVPQESGFQSRLNQITARIAGTKRREDEQKRLEEIEKARPKTESDADRAFSEFAFLAGFKVDSITDERQTDIARVVLANEGIDEALGRRILGELPGFQNEKINLDFAEKGDIGDILERIGLFSDDPNVQQVIERELAPALEPFVKRAARRDPFTLDLSSFVASQIGPALDFRDIEVPPAPEAPGLLRPPIFGEIADPSFIERQLPAPEDPLLAATREQIERGGTIQGIIEDLERRFDPRELPLPPGIGAAAEERTGEAIPSLAATPIQEAFERAVPQVGVQNVDILNVLNDIAPDSPGLWNFIADRIAELGEQFQDFAGAEFERRERAAAGDPAELSAEGQLFTREEQAAFVLSQIDRTPISFVEFLRSKEPSLRAEFEVTPTGRAEQAERDEIARRFEIEQRIGDPGILQLLGAVSGTSSARFNFLADQLEGLEQQFEGLTQPREPEDFPVTFQMFRGAGVPKTTETILSSQAPEEIRRLRATGFGDDRGNAQIIEDALARATAANAPPPLPSFPGFVAEQVPSILDLFGTTPAGQREIEAAEEAQVRFKTEQILSDPSTLSFLRAEAGESVAALTAFTKDLPGFAEEIARAEIAGGPMPSAQDFITGARQRFELSPAGLREEQRLADEAERERVAFERVAEETRLFEEQGLIREAALSPEVLNLIREQAGENVSQLRFLGGELPRLATEFVQQGIEGGFPSFVEREFPTLAETFRVSPAGLTEELRLEREAEQAQLGIEREAERALLEEQAGVERDVLLDPATFNLFAGQAGESVARSRFLFGELPRLAETFAGLEDRPESFQEFAEPRFDRLETLFQATPAALSERQQLAATTEREAEQRQQRALRSGGRTRSARVRV